MLFALMKFVTWLLSPLMLGLAGVLAGGYWVWRDQTRRGLWTLAASLVWLWIWSSPWFLILFGGALERGFPPAKVESLPRADAIVVLGGGIAPPTACTRYAELSSGAATPLWREEIRAPTRRRKESGTRAKTRSTATRETRPESTGRAASDRATPSSRPPEHPPAPASAGSTATSRISSARTACPQSPMILTSTRLFRSPSNSP
jgi:membrane peptidoglycan carboxypeptidase